MNPGGPIHDAKPLKRRLFFALWPDDATRVRLGELQRALPPSGGRDMSVDNLHITLFFLGDCDESLLPCLEEVGRTLKGEAFELIFDEVGVFDRARVLWAGVRRPPDALLSLQETLAGRLVERCGQIRDHRPFAPHLTLRRNTRQSCSWPTTIVPIRWRVDAVALVESINDDHSVRYQPLCQWPLKPE